LDNIMSLLDWSAIGAAANKAEAIAQAIEKLAEGELDWPSGVDGSQLAKSAKNLSDRLRGDFGGWNLYTRIHYKICVCEHHFYRFWIGHNELEDVTTPWVKSEAGGLDGKGLFADYTDAWATGHEAGDAALAKWKEDNQDELGG